MSRFTLTISDGTSFEFDQNPVVDGNGWVVISVDGAIVGVPPANIRFIRDNDPQIGPPPGPVSEVTE